MVFRYIMALCGKVPVIEHRQIAVTEPVEVPAMACRFGKLNAPKGAATELARPNRFLKPVRSQRNTHI